MKNFDWLTKRPVAHRGYFDPEHDIYENTLTAFERAMTHNFAIECDLQFSADGIPVVFHDFDLQRLCGLNAKTRDKMANELSMLSVGGTSDRIPKLKNMLDLIKGNVPIILELKGQEGDDDGFAASVLECVEEYSGPLAVMSFDHHLIKDFRLLGAEIPVGLVAMGTDPDVFFTHDEALSLGVDFISYRLDDLPNPFINAQRSKNMPVISWTIRNEDDYQRGLALTDQVTFEGFNPDNIEH